MKAKHSCTVCGKKDLDRDTVGINKKLLGSKIKSFYCMDCLANYLECTVDDILDKIEEFKAVSRSAACLWQASFKRWLHALFLKSDGA